MRLPTRLGVCDLFSSILSVQLEQSKCERWEKDEMGYIPYHSHLSKAFRASSKLLCKPCVLWSLAMRTSRYVFPHEVPCCRTQSCTKVRRIRWFLVKVHEKPLDRGRPWHLGIIAVPDTKLPSTGTKSHSRQEVVSWFSSSHVGAAAALDEPELALFCVNMSVAGQPVMLIM